MEPLADSVLEGLAGMGLRRGVPFGDEQGVTAMFCSAAGVRPS
jgi:hypothetical protein